MNTLKIFEVAIIATMFSCCVACGSSADGDDSSPAAAPETEPSPAEQVPDEPDEMEVSEPEPDPSEDPTTGGGPSPTPTDECLPIPTCGEFDNGVQRTFDTTCLPDNVVPCSSSPAIDTACEDDRDCELCRFEERPPLTPDGCACSSCPEFAMRGGACAALLSGLAICDSGDASCDGNSCRLMEAVCTDGACMAIPRRPIQ